MLLEQLKTRLIKEYEAFREYLITASFTASDLVNRSYEVACKEAITSLFHTMKNYDNAYSEEMIRWIMSKNNSLDFLYSVWRHTDYLIVTDFAGLLHDELVIRKAGTDE